MTVNLDAIFKPKSIAVIGASNKKGTIGHEILKNLVNYGFKGQIFPVNPKSANIENLKCYPTVLDVPDEIDLAIIVVPRDLVSLALEQCGEKKVKGVVAITSGFKEIGEEGAAKEAELIRIVRKYDMRMIGPNCYGVVNTDPEFSVNSTFSKLKPLRGNIGFLSQSGALGEVVIDYTNKLNLGFSMFVSIGNKADVSDNDILQYWENDPNTDIILLYMENVDDSKRFIQVSSRIAGKKPIVAVKAGRTEAGARAISSHTGVLAGLDVGFDALFDRCGILRVTSMDELFDVAIALSNQPLPKGDGIAIITNAGGPGILATDAVTTIGMKMAKFEDKTIRYLKDNLPPVAAINNPIDVIASGGPDSYGVAMDAVLSDKNVDGIIVIFVPPILVDHKAVINVIIEMIEKHKNNKAVLSCFMGSPDGIAGSEEMTKHKIPIYTFPESAAKAMSAMIRYRKWIDRPEGKIVEYDVDKQRAKKIVDTAIKSGQSIIMGERALNVLDSYGIKVAGSMKVKNQKDIEKAISKIGFPMVMKIDDPEITHKTDVGGVMTNLENQANVTDAFKVMEKKFNHPQRGFAGVIIQEMVKDGIETIMGMNKDSSFGSLMMFGLGGIYVEVMKDVVFKIHPITDYDAEEMIKSVKGYRLLTGFRGYPAVNIKVIEQTLLRLSQLITDFPVFTSLDINPFIATAKAEESKVVDARFILKS